MKARGRPGGARRIGHRKPRREPEPAQPCGKVGDQFFFATEQMAGPFDVEENTIGAVVLAPKISAQGRSGRRVTRRPEREPPQRCIVGGGIRGAQLQKIRFRPCVGQGFADRKPRRFRRLVQGGDARAAGAGDGKDERPLRIDRLARRFGLRRHRLRREKTLNRPARQPD